MTTMSVDTTLRNRVLEALLRIPKGKITTYAALARNTGTHPRAAARILSSNKNPDKYPCFKVIHSDGRLGGFAFGVEDKVRRLEKDRVQVVGNRVPNFEEKLFEF